MPLIDHEMSSPISSTYLAEQVAGSPPPKVLYIRHFGLILGGELIACVVETVEEVVLVELELVSPVASVVVFVSVVVGMMPFVEVSGEKVVLKVVVGVGVAVIVVFDAGAALVDVAFDGPKRLFGVI